MKELIESHWQGWKVVRKLGEGGFGAVYEIQRDIFGKTESAALKVVSIPQTSAEIDEIYSEGYDQETVKTYYKNYLENFVQEYSIMLDLRDNSNVVSCTDQIFFDLFVGSLNGRDNGNNRRNTDNNAQHCQKRSEFVRKNALEGL